MRQHEISGEFLGEHRVFLNDGGAVRVIIGTIEDRDGNEITIRGEANERQLTRGLSFRFWGHWHNHHKFGRQFVFSAFVQETPATETAIIAYLKQCDGIGYATAAKIWQQWGQDSIRMLREEPEAVAAAIPRLKAEKAKAAAERLQKDEKIERAKVDLIGLLHGRKIPKKVIDKLLHDYGSAAAFTVRQNPYLLMRYRGCGFLTTDKLYVEFGHNPARMKRQALCLWHSIAKNSDGDTWFPLTNAKEALFDSIGGAGVDFNRAMQLSLRAKMLTQRVEYGTRWIAESRKAASERQVAEYLVWAEEESEETPLLWPDVDGLNLYPHQKEELKKALRGIIAILAGSPGTGKTHSAAELIRAVMKSVGSDMIAVCAPTGKAAVRVSEAMQNNGLDLRATTIHSLLQVNSAEDGWSFHYGPGNPLPHTFIICDESSMLDIDLMRSLLSARGRGTHVLFIGDPNQLAPVGHGAPLRDMIAAGVPCGELTEIQRNSGRIVKACAEIRDYKRFAASEKLDPPEENLIVVRREEPEQQIELLQSVIQKIQDSPDQKYDAIWDVQVLVAVNKKSPLGRKTLNRKLQDLLNPSGHRCPGSPFRVGDKIINTKNGWFPAFTAGPRNIRDREEGEEEKHYVANGEQAEVLQVEPARTIARLNAPDRTIVIPRGQQQEDDDSRGDDDSDDSSTGTGCSWELGYSISCHKCVHPDTFVETDQGLLPIRDVASSGMIATRQGYARYGNPVHYYDVPSVNITTEDGHTITVSNEHKCEVWNGDSWVMKPANELREGEWVRQRLGATIEPAFPVMLPGSDCGKANEYRIPQSVTAELAEFLGLMVADGTVFRSGFRLAKNQKETVERFCELAEILFGLKKPDITHTDGPLGGCWCAEYSSQHVTSWLRKLDGLLPHTKAVPRCILRSPSDMHAHFLRGLFEDGSVHLSNGRLDHINWTTSSPDLARAVRVMLLRLGIVSSVNSQRKKQHSLYIYSHFAKRFESVVGFISKEKRARLSLPAYGNGESSRQRIPVSIEYVRSIRKTVIDSVGVSVYQNAIRNGYISRAMAQRYSELAGINEDFGGWHYSRIKGISKTRCPVMCVEVPSEGVFLQNGFPWSNSQGSEFPIVIVLIDESGSARRVCTRNWLYTAISRAKAWCMLIGKKEIADEMCRRDGLRRKTFLVETINELRAEKRREELIAEVAAWSDEVFDEILEGVV